MGLTILNDFQKKILEQFKKTSLAKKYYLAGGTALAEFYLKHRKSEDLDFFTEEELDISFKTPGRWPNGLLPGGGIGKDFLIILLINSSL